VCIWRAGNLLILLRCLKPCVRHHVTIIAQLAVQGLPFVNTPECTYDDDSTGDKSPESSFGKSDVFITVQFPIDLPSTPPASGSGTHSSDFRKFRVSLAEDFASLTTTVSRPSPGSENIINVGHASESLLSNSDLFASPGPFDAFGLTTPARTPVDSLSGSSKASPYVPPDTESLIFPNYPQNLPAPELLFHLIDVFFTSVPFSNQLIHKPTLLASLNCPPGDRRFPVAALLHAICGLAALYSPVIETPKTVFGPASSLFREPEEIGKDFHGTQIELAYAIATYEGRNGRNSIANLQGSF
jgi:hypothetical protein